MSLSATPPNGKKRTSRIAAFAQPSPSQHVTVAVPSGVTLPAKGEGDSWALWLSQLQYLTELTPERRDQGHWINIHWSKNREILGEKHRQRINDIRDAGIVEINERYSTGRDGSAAFSKSYRLTSEYRTGQSQLHALATKPAIKKATKVWEPDLRNLGAAGIHFHEHFESFHLDQAALTDPNLSDHWTLANAARWMSRHAFALRCDHRRYHALISQTPRVTRPYIQTETGEALSIVDVSASQPVLIGYLTSQGITTVQGLRGALLPYGAGFSIKNAPADVRKWIDLCEQRAIYRHFWLAIREQPEPVYRTITTDTGRQVAVDLRDQSEAASKRGSLVPLFDKTEATRQSPVFQIIELDFPTIAAWILETKRHGHQTTAHLCQRLESHLMIDGCGDVLRRKFPCEPVQPIHDALMVRSEFAPTARGIIAEQFERFGLHPTVKIELA